MGSATPPRAQSRSCGGHLDKFALELDVTMRNYSSLLQSDPIPETTKKPFSEEEIKVMWHMQDAPWVDSILFLLYSGFRISEMLDLETAKVNLETGTITGGTKTKAGKDRVVPIHSKVRHIVERRMKEGNQHLFYHRPCRISTYSRRYSSTKRSKGPGTKAGKVIYCKNTDV